MCLIFPDSIPNLDTPSYMYVYMYHIEPLHCAGSMSLQELEERSSVVLLTITSLSPTILPEVRNIFLLHVSFYPP